MIHCKLNTIPYFVKKLFGLTLFSCIALFQPYFALSQPKYDISPFKGLIICASSFPTNYYNVGVFSLDEADNKGFDKNQNDDFILTLPSGYEFNPSASHSVTYHPNKDITSITLNSVTSSQISITNAVAPVGS